MEEETCTNTIEEEISEDEQIRERRSLIGKITSDWTIRKEVIKNTMGKV